MTQRARFLMCEPHHFAVTYDINPWMSSNIGKASNTLARAQWLHLTEALSDAGAELVVINNQPAELPDLVFTANAACIHGNRAYLSRFAKPERQPEQALYHEALARAGLEVDSRFVNHDIPFEGAGDALQIEGGPLVMSWGYRSNPKAAAMMREAERDLMVSAVQLIDARFYHLDTCFCPLTDGSVIWYPGAFSDEARHEIHIALELRGSIEVTEDEARDFCCNAVEVNDTLIANRWSERLQGLLSARGYRTVEVDLSEFMKAGGAAKCLTLRLD